MNLNCFHIHLQNAKYTLSPIFNHKKDYDMLVTVLQIFLCLHALLGQSKPTSQEALSWTILRGSGYAGIEQDHSDVETTTGYYSKLHVALNILHECFVTMIEPRTQSDLIADILFNKE